MYLRTTLTQHTGPQSRYTQQAHNPYRYNLHTTYRPTILKRYLFKGFSPKICAKIQGVSLRDYHLPHFIFDDTWICPFRISDFSKKNNKNFWMSTILHLYPSNITDSTSKMMFESSHSLLLSSLLPLVRTSQMLTVDWWNFLTLFQHFATLPESCLF